MTVRRCSEKVKLDPGVPKKGYRIEGYRTRGTQRNNLERGVPKPGVPKKILDVGNPGSRGTEKRDTEKIFLDPGVPKKGYRKKGVEKTTGGETFFGLLRVSIRIWLKIMIGVPKKGYRKIL